MAWASVAIPAAMSLVGGMMQSDAASSASSAQNKASASAIAEQRRQYDLNRADQSQFRDTGISANKRLAYLLGLSTDNGSTGTTGLSYDVLRKQLTPQFTTQTQKTTEVPITSGWENTPQPTYQTTYEDNVNQGGLDAEILKRMQADEAQRTSTAQGDSNFGSLLKKFSTSDLEADPVYQSGLKFGLDQGTGAINARATQMGGYDSGATLKALTRYANDYGSTKANESYNRFNNDQSNVFNRLSGVSGTGQTATNQIQAAGTNTAKNISNLTTGEGNASAAGIVGGANAWGNALSGVSGAYNNYNNNETLKKLLAGNGGVSGNNISYGNNSDYGFN